MSEQDRQRRGILYGLGAYGLWGAVPLFWPLVADAGSLELLAHRVVWSLVISGLLAVVLASVNIFGGFAVTARMLAMYKKKDKPVLSKAEGPVVPEKQA